MKKVNIFHSYLDNEIILVESIRGEVIRTTARTYSFNTRIKLTDLKKQKDLVEYIGSFEDVKPTKNS